MGRRHLYTMGDVARAAGLSRQTLHTYALLGLIREVETTSGGRRLYSARVFRRLDEIRGLQADHTLAEIRDIYAARGGKSR